MGTAIAMGARRVSINNFSYLRLKWRTPKAGVTGSNPVGRATLEKIAHLGLTADLCNGTSNLAAHGAAFDKTR